ncbi:MAG TPA: hypothetical protein PKK26_13285 [Candidatus Wallbacteria bacterium]|nr:hypothetical protein [Candidatus Wallbacteria bacterium]
MLEKIKQYYNAALTGSEKLRSGDRAIIISALLIIMPLVFFSFVYPAQEFSLKKAKNLCENVRSKFNNLKSEENAAQAKAEEIAAKKAEMDYLNDLILGSDAAIQLLNAVTNFAEKNSLDIKFMKKHAQFDKIYEKAFLPKDASGAPDEASRIFCKVLPVEVVLRSTTAEFLMFINFIEGFKKLNFVFRKFNASRTDDGKIEAVITLEMILEVKFAQGGGNL